MESSTEISSGDTNFCSILDEYLLILIDIHRAMRTYKFPGVEDVRDEVLLYIFQLVCVRGGANFNSVQVSEIFFIYTI